MLPMISKTSPVLAQLLCPALKACGRCIWSVNSYWSVSILLYASVLRSRHVNAFKTFFHLTKIGILLVSHAAHLVFNHFAPTTTHKPPITFNVCGDGEGGEPVALHVTS